MEGQGQGLAEKRAKRSLKLGQGESLSQDIPGKDMVIHSCYSKQH